MAHTYGTKIRAPAAGTSTANPVSGTLAIGAADTVLVALVKWAANVRAGGAVTVNATAMTQVGTVSAGTTGAEAWCELWYYLGPPKGGQATISVPNTGTSQMWVIAATGAAAAGNTSVFDVGTAKGAVGTSPFVALTTATDGEIIFNVVADGAQTFGGTARAGGTILYSSDDGAHGGGGLFQIQAVAGIGTAGWLHGSSEDYGIISAAFKEATSGPGTVTVPDSFQAQVSDPAVLGVLTPITVAEGAQAQVSDAATLSLAIPSITVADANQAQVSDPAILGVWTPITPAEGNQAQVSDAASLGVWTPITVTEGRQAQVSDAAILGVLTPITVAEAVQAQTSDAASVTFSEGGAAVNITPADANQAQVSDAATVSAITPITPTEGTQAQVSDAATLTVIYPVTVSESNQAQVSDAASVSFQGIGVTNITPDEGHQAQVSDAAVVGVQTPITVAEGHQAQSSDTATLGVYYPVTVSEAHQAQTSDAPSITSYAPTYYITVADATQAQVSDAIGIGVITPIAVDEAHQAQQSDLAVAIVYGIVLHGSRKLYKVGSRTIFKVRR